MLLTQPQQFKFWRLFGAAWRAYAAGVGENATDHAAANAWRKEQLAECGFDSLTRVDRKNGYTVVMLHLAQIANIQSEIEHYATNGERVMRHLIGETLVKIGAMESPPRVLSWSYAAAIMEHMHLPADLNDVPKERLLDVFMALDKHKRRIAVAAGDAWSNKGNKHWPHFGERRRAKERKKRHQEAA